MVQFIDKSAVVAEIEKYISNYKAILNKVDKSSYKWLDSAMSLESKIDVLQHLLSFLDILEVKEVDDEKCKEYDKALSIAKAWYKSSDSSAQERNVTRMIMGDKVREEL